MAHEEIGLIARLGRHLRLTWHSYRRTETPPLLVVFITSACNMRCEHCFFWRELNHRDDLTKGELLRLSDSLGTVEQLSLSGGEPFLRQDLGEICRHFIRRNRVRQIYIPTNGFFTDRIVRESREILQEQDLQLLVIEFSLDGMPAFHDRFRNTPGAFARAMETCRALADVQRDDCRLRVHAASTANNTNLDEIRQLTAYLYKQCPQMDHHDLAIIHGSPREPSLLTPDLAQYAALYRDIRAVWQEREAGRYGGIVEPMLQWAKLQTLSNGRQVAPCRAGVLTGVVYANGDVSACELREPLGNLRSATFTEIWNSPQARETRASIARSECYCTKEVYLWPGLVFQPFHLARALIGARTVVDARDGGIAGRK